MSRFLKAGANVCKSKVDLTKSQSRVVGFDGIALVTDGDADAADPVCGTALANGTAAHALDFDDTNFAMMGHPTAPVLSAAPGTESSDSVGNHR